MEEQMETEEPEYVQITPDDPLSEYLDCLKYFDAESVARYKRAHELREARRFKKRRKGNHALDEILLPKCNHEELHNEDMLSSYELLYAVYVACITENSFKRKKSDCICNVDSCKTKVGESRIHACLSCVYFGCYEKRHIHQHGKRKIHFYAMDTDSGNIFCSSCEDYIYPGEYMEVARNQTLIASCKKDSTNMVFKWEPTPDEVDILQDAWEKNELVFDNKNGVPGIVNIGMFTCYFNVLIQCLIHAPIFKDHLLSLQHSCNNKDECLICQLIIVVQMSVSGKVASFHLSELFRSFFKHKEAQKFASADQEDSHECLLYIIECLMIDAAFCLENPLIWSHIIKDTFFFRTGKRQICKVNGCVHTPPTETEEKTIVLFSLALTQKPSEKSFEELLRINWTMDLCDFRCSQCNSIGVINETITKKLPDIMNFVLAPPMALGPLFKVVDMKPFVAKTSDVQDDSLEYKYYLCGAVIHYGSTNSGHYVCYIRKDKDSWFFCNDEDTEKVNIDDILNEEVIILFYHKMHMGFESEVRPNENEEQQSSGAQSAQTN